MKKNKPVGVCYKGELIHLTYNRNAGGRGKGAYVGECQIGAETVQAVVSAKVDKVAVFEKEGSADCIVFNVGRVCMGGTHTARRLIHA